MRSSSSTTTTMPILLPTSSSSFKTTAAFVITGVLSVAAAVSFTVPSVSHFVASSVPIVYDNTVFLLKPPYLYLVINCIIVSIVATSKLTHQKSSSDVDDSDISQVITPVHVTSDHDINTGYLNVVSDYTGFVEIQNDVRNDAAVDLTVEDVSKSAEIVGDDKTIVHDGEAKQPETEKLESSNDSPETEKSKPSNDSPEKETDKTKPKNDSPAVSIPKQSRKPPRFGQQKSLKPNPEGGGGKRKTALGVTKPPRKQDTLESTWKKITEGRSTPLTKHLTKSDTWQERTHHVQSSSSQKKKEKMTKSENLNDVNTPAEDEKPRLNRKPSPGQEELNRRVEAFINKFNEEMRLQRLESLAKYNEMLNSGTRL